MKKHCCKLMQEKIDNWECDQHEEKFECPDAIIDYSERIDEYGLIVFGDAFSSIAINYCPWCGCKLDSKRDQWFDELDKIGFSDPLFDDNIPDKYKSGAGYQDKNSDEFK